MFKRPVIFLLALLCAVSCQYKAEIHYNDTQLNFRLDSLKATQAYLSILPDDDMVYYTVNIISVDSLNKLMALGGEALVFEKHMSYLDAYYKDVKEYFSGAAYQASFDDVCLTKSQKMKFITGLEPESDYVVFGFCINPDNRQALGAMQVKAFTTPDFDGKPSRMEIKFMIQDTDECFYWYTKPTVDGKVTKDPYVADIVADEVLYADPYYGDISTYALVRYAYLKNKGLLDYYVHSDISRIAAEDVKSGDEGKGYTLLAVPYNLLNLSNVYHLHFTYTPGIKTGSYSRDE